jgi:hypothetical protein
LGYFGNHFLGCYSSHHCPCSNDTVKDIVPFEDPSLKENLVSMQWGASRYLSLCIQSLEVDFLFYLASRKLIDQFVDHFL